MLRSYMIVALRNLARHRVYSLINIAGMALGMACCILILLWVRHELSYDAFHDKLDRLFLVCTKHEYGTDESLSGGSPPAVAQALKEEYPEIVNATRTRSASELVVRYGDIVFSEQVSRVDPAFLEMFSFPLISGDLETALDDPHSIVLTQSIARKYFGDEDPLDKVLVVDTRYDFLVTGVVADPPESSTIQFDILVNLEFDKEFFGTDISTWYNCSFFTLIELSEGADWRALEARLADRVKRSDPETIITLFLWPFADLHLYSISGRGGQIERVGTFAMVAGLVLLIACVNFMNLTTARSGHRAKEVGVRKVVGARRGEVMTQFFCESLVQAMAALLLALILVELFLPWFSGLTRAGLELDLFGSPSLLLGILLITLVAGVVAGSYPALLLSSFRPVRVLKGAVSTGARGLWFRRFLVVFQFTLSIALIICTAVVFRQHQLLRDKNIGFDTTRVVCQPLTEQLFARYEAIKRELEADPGIRHVTWSTSNPAGVYWNGSGWTWQGKGADVDPFVTYMGVDYDFLETLGIEMAAGEFFSLELGAAAEKKVIINETFAELIGAPSAVGLELGHGDGTFTVLGVVRDFHFKPVYSDIGPLVIYFRPEGWDRGYLLGKLEAGFETQGIERLEAAWQTHAPDTPFEVRFLDDAFARLYRREQQMGEVLGAFAILAIFISGLGLFGLASFMAEQRTKEIGVRKVLGASVWSIVLLLSHEFTRWVLLANLLAWPLAFLIMRRWLERFTFQTDLSPGLFVAAATAALVVAVLTVSVQAVRAANTNPARALRYE